MKLILRGEIYEVETVVTCNAGIFSDDPNKVGSVRIYGRDGRAVLAMVEQARMLYEEYPEDCLRLQPEEKVAIEEKTREIFADITLLLAKGDGFSLLGTSVDSASTHDALTRLHRYATRLVRVDVP